MTAKKDKLFKKYIPVVSDMAVIIKAKRMKLKLTQAYVAKKSYISVSALEKIEQGVGGISVRTLCALSAVLDINPISLLEC
ncbi:MAG TPA: helix-turn-helix transcriptional regulator [Elusimicrobiales bacterium]|nr:helix-turn-helix transcriptional regulator [Elusimicrobiales bacterium]